jgi:hypothetical protein
MEVILKNNKIKLTLETSIKGILVGLLFCFNHSVIQGQMFSEVAIESGIDFIPVGGPLYAGVAVIDFDNDGFEDLYIPGGLQMDALYRNNGDGTYTNVAVSAGLSITQEYMTAGVVAADIDNDGYRDIFVTTLIKISAPNEWAPNLLFHNNGDGTFTDISVSSNIALDSVNSGPASFGDINNDGFIDLYVCNYFKETPYEIFDSSGTPDYSALTSEPNNLYLNNGDNTFTEIAQFTTVSDTGVALGVAFFDFNNDANMDLYVANDDAAFPGFDTYTNSLFKNLLPISESFEDIGVSSGTNALAESMGVAIADYDRNGFMDIYVTFCGLSALYRNNGDETFTDVAEAVGAADADVKVDPELNNFKTLLYRYSPRPNYDGSDISYFEICIDGVDSTRCYDFRLTIDIVPEVLREDPILFYSFTDGNLNLYALEDLPYGIVTEAKVEVEMNSSTLICMEIPDSIHFRWNSQTINGIEEIITDSTILPSVGWGANFFDFDHDIDLDLFVANGHETIIGPLADNPNSFYRNLGNGQFENVSEEAGVLNPWSARGSVITDYDNDGDEDIFVVNLKYVEGYRDDQEPRALLYKNNLVQTGFNNWLKVKLNGVESNKDGIGAMLRLFFGPNKAMRQIDGGSSAFSHNSIIAHFGTRAYTMIDSLQITWPGGCKQTLFNVDANQILTVTQDCGELVSSATDEVINSELKDVSIYPNPTSNELFFNFNFDFPKVVIIELFDINGNQLQQSFTGLTYKDQSVKMDVSGLSSGTYIYSIKSSGKMYSNSFIVVN